MYKILLISRGVTTTTFKHSLIKYSKLSIRQLALMAILLALFSIIKYLATIIFRGPLNFNVEFLFWIFNGIIFGPIIGSVFSIICDTVFTFFTSGIAYWTIEYAIVPPLVSLITWFFWKSYKQENKYTLIVSIGLTIISIAMAIVITFIQISRNKIRYEGIKTSEIFPIAIYAIISLFTISLFGFLIFCLIKYFSTRNWKYIKWVYNFSLITVVIVLFRWIWGPYAYYAYLKRFSSKNIDFSKQYILTLFGIVTKSCLSIPIATAISLPLLNVIERYAHFDNEKNRY